MKKMVRKLKYPKPQSLIKYYIEIELVDLSRIHNGIKKSGNGDPFCKYQIYLEVARKYNNRHKTKIFRHS